LKWLSSHTQIPVPEVLYYDATQNNELGYEYMIMSMVGGRSFEVLRKELLAPQYEEQLEGLLDQIVNVVSQLGSHSWQHIGGLQEMITSSKDDGSGSMLVPGPVVDESMWQVPELDLFWAGGETFQSLNIGGPFPSYTSFLTAQAEKFIYAIEHHEALTHMRELTPRIKALMAVMDESEEELNKTRLVLAHRDLHFGNIMYDVPTKRITAVLDWEFACVVPAPRWDPHKAFLWNGVDNQEKLGLKERVVKKCYERGIRFFEDVEYTGQKQKHVQLAMNFLRAIVEVVPRGTIDKPVEDWTREMLKHMEALHII
jgi:aminoglycoside phosphotransferase (APT) family kinase protein